jgi:hypothetical protein
MRRRRIRPIPFARTPRPVRSIDSGHPGLRTPWVAQWDGRRGLRRPGWPRDCQPPRRFPKSLHKKKRPVPPPSGGTGRETIRGSGLVYCTVKTNGAVAPLAVVIFMVYTWVPLLAGSELGMVQFHLSRVALFWLLPG